MGHFAFITQHIKPFSIPESSKKEGLSLINLVNEMIKLVNDTSMKDEDNKLKMIEEIENKRNELVYKSYEITDEEKSIIESSV